MNYVRKGDIHNSFSLFLLKLLNYIDDLHVLRLSFIILIVESN